MLQTVLGVLDIWLFVSQVGSGQVGIFPNILPCELAPFSHRQLHTHIVLKGFVLLLFSVLCSCV